MPAATKKTITEAFVELQADLKPVKKTGENPHFRSQYMEFDGIVEQNRPVLAKHGFAFTHQMTQEMEGMLTVTAILLYKDGTNMQSSLHLPYNNSMDIQKTCALNSYGKRHSLMALLGQAGEDLDGNDAVPKAEAAPGGQDPRRSKPQASQASKGGNQGYGFPQENPWVGKITGGKIAKKTDTWTLYSITGDNGIEFTTFSSTLFEEGGTAKALGAPVTVTWEEKASKSGKKSASLISIVPVDGPEKDPATGESVPPADDEIPF